MSSCLLFSLLSLSLSSSEVEFIYWIVFVEVGSGGVYFGGVVLLMMKVTAVVKGEVAVLLMMKMATIDDKRLNNLCKIFD